MARNPGERHNKQTAELAASDEYSNSSSVMEAERIVQKAFGAWALAAGIGETRASAVIYQAGQNASDREFRLIGRAGDEALRETES